MKKEFTLWVLLGLFVVACGQEPQATPAPRPSAAPDPTPTGRYVPPTHRPSLASSPSLTNPPTVRALASPTSYPQPTFTPLPIGPLAIRTLPPPSGDGPLPALLAEIQGPAGASIVDMFLDRQANHLYILDSSVQVHVLDADTFADLATIRLDPQLVEPWMLNSLPRRFTLDATHNRLYVSLGDAAVLVLDTTTLAELDVLAPGGPVAVDSVRDRFYVGTQRYWESAPDVRVYDGTTREKVDQIPQSGVVAYNPARDEIYILGPDKVYRVDAATLKISGELCVYGDCRDEGCFLPTCVGAQATDLHLFAERNLLAVEYYEFQSRRLGVIGLPRFFDATTLEEVTDLVRTAYEFRCDHSLALLEPVNGRLYQGSRDAAWLGSGELQMLSVYDLKGTHLSTIPGIPFGVANPSTGQLYSSYVEGQMRIVDLASLMPQGVLPVSCVHTLDAGTGRIYGLDNGSLFLFSEGGGWPEPSAVNSGPEHEKIVRIQLSPDYVHDRTLFLSTASHTLYRSTDGGQTWVKLGGGLPEYHDVVSFSLVISPDFADDQTLFVTGFHHFGQARFSAEGVYRSTDGGDNWQPVWQGLTDLFIWQLEISPNFGQDGTVTATSPTAKFCSVDRGQRWALVERGDFPVPPGGEIFCLDLEQTDDCLTLQFGQGLFSAPGDSNPPVSYLLTGCNLFRSMDDGLTWERWYDERLIWFKCYGLSDPIMTAGAISPLLPDGWYQIFVGTGDGQFWVLDPDEVEWLPADLEDLEE